MKITTVIDNRTSAENMFIAEHGLCFLVEAEGKKLLFDTGQSAKTLVNIHKLGIDLEAVDYAVISHGHYDHAGGYRTLVDNGLHCPLYTGADFFRKRFSNNDGELKYLGVDFDPVYLEQHEIKHITCGEFTALSENIFIMSCFSRNNSFENVPSRFIYEEADGSYLHDLFENEVCLVIRENNALNVVVGCSHIGIANILSKISNFFNLPIKYVFGGIHLKEATGDVARHTIDAVLALGVENLYFNHCSGDEVLKLLIGSESSDTDKHRLFKTGYLAAGVSFSTL